MSQRMESSSSVGISLSNINRSSVKSRAELISKIRDDLFKKSENPDKNDLHKLLFEHESDNFEIIRDGSKLNTYLSYEDDTKIRIKIGSKWRYERINGNIKW